MSDETEGIDATDAIEEIEEIEDAPPPVRKSYLTDVNASVRRTFSDSWMVTFTDLVALMLAFFVLLFSMSAVDLFKWQNMVRSLAGEMDSVQAREGAKPAEEFQIEQTDPLPGTDLDYLTPVVEQRVEAEPALAAGVVWRATGRTVLSLPAAALFSGEETTLARRANPAIYALSRLVQSLDNQIEIQGHSARVDGRDSESQGWGTSLAQASALASSLVEAGYRGQIVARGYGSSRQGEFTIPGSSGATDRLRNRIDVVIHEIAPQGQ
jgi:chemotaxis protein MotB